MIRDIFLPRARLLWILLALCGQLAAARCGHAQQLPLPSEPSAASQPAPAQGAPAEAVPVQDTLALSAPIVHKVQVLNERLDMIVNTSRILSLDQRIPQAQVNNPELLNLVALSPTQVQISAKKAGVTQVNLWGEDRRIFTVNVVILGDARELAMILKSQFPQTALTVTPVGSSALISGYVDQQDLVPRIIRIAEEFYPKIINNMTVSGVQQVLLHVKVMEVSRTKLRNMGFDFAKVTNGSLMMSGISGLLTATSSAAAGTISTTVTPTTQQALQVALYSNGGNSAFFGVLEALRQDGLSKVLAEPDLVTVSGRPAYFLEGGELGYQVSSLAGSTVQFKEYGTRVDVVPIVLGNGRIRLEVRPSVSEPDYANGTPTVPALKTREVDTGVEMRAGQTLAIAGLVQQRVDSTSVGVPWLSELPYLGTLFRKVKEDLNEVELLITVTPELVDAMDANQVPRCGPGLNSTSPSDWDLFFKGHLEVPKCCGNGEGGGAVCQDGNCAVPPGGVPAGPQYIDPAAAPAAPAAPGSPQGRYNSYPPANPNIAAGAGPSNHGIIEPSFIGPIGYDVLN